MAQPIKFFCSFLYLSLTAWLVPFDAPDDDEDEDPGLGPDCFAREKKLLNYRFSDMKLKEFKYKYRTMEL